MDLVVRGGTAVTAEWEGVVDIGVDGERIVQLGGPMQGDTEIDARGLYVLPGGVDPHVHLSPPTEDPADPSWVDDFDSGSRAAVAGGITTVGNITFPGYHSTMVDAVTRDRATAEATSAADFFLHPVIRDANDANLAQIEDLVADGYPSLKIFLSFRRFDQHVDRYVEALVRCGRAGGVVMAHCEDAAVNDCCGRALDAAGLRGIEQFPNARPVESEAIATARAIALSEAAGCPLYVVHLASEDALDAVRRGRRRGTTIIVETRPLYLHLSDDVYRSPEGGRYAGAPPIRSQRDREALWQSLRWGEIQVVATDHAPWMLAEKVDASHGATKVPHGVADLETSLPMLWSEGVRTGRISRQRFVEVTASNPARIFGLSPRKGTIAVGADADLVVWDQDLERVVDAREMHTRADYSPYDGWSVRGWPRFTIRRGEVVASGTRVDARPGSGRELRRPAARLQLT